MGHSLHRFLQQPKKVFFFCLVFISLSSIFNGVLWRLWALHRDHDRRAVETLAAQDQILMLTKQLEQAKDPVFIERQARDRFDLADENDLVFVFPSQ